MNIHNGKHFSVDEGYCLLEGEKNSYNKTQLRPMMNPTHLLIIMTGLR